MKKRKKQSKIMKKAKLMEAAAQFSNKKEVH